MPDKRCGIEAYPRVMIDSVGIMEEAYGDRRGGVQTSTLLQIIIQETQLARELRANRTGGRSIGKCYSCFCYISGGDKSRLAGQDKAPQQGGTSACGLHHD
jgi:hypothetical protein